MRAIAWRCNATGCFCSQAKRAGPAAGMPDNGSGDGPAPWSCGIPAVGSPPPAVAVLIGAPPTDAAGKVGTPVSPLLIKAPKASGRIVCARSSAAWAIDCLVCATCSGVERRIDQRATGEALGLSETHL